MCVRAGARECFLVHKRKSEELFFSINFFLSLSHLTQLPRKSLALPVYFHLVELSVVYFISKTIITYIYQYVYPTNLSFLSTHHLHIYVESPSPQHVQDAPPTFPKQRIRLIKKWLNKNPLFTAWQHFAFANEPKMNRDSPRTGQTWPPECKPSRTHPRQQTRDSSSASGIKSSLSASTAMRADAAGEGAKALLGWWAWAAGAHLRGVSVLNWGLNGICYARVNEVRSSRRARGSECEGFWDWFCVWPRVCTFVLM